MVVSIGCLRWRKCYCRYGEEQYEYTISMRRAVMNVYDIVGLRLATRHHYVVIGVTRGGCRHGIRRHGLLTLDMFVTILEWRIMLPLLLFIKR